MSPHTARSTRRQLVPFALLSASYFAHIGFFNPYLALWLQGLGLSLWLIGLLTALQAATRLFAPYAWGWLSDRSGERVGLLRYGAGAALLCSLGLYAPDNTVWLGVVLLLMFTHTSAMMPMSEAAMAHLVSRNGSFDAKRYGRVRLWGSIGFLLTVFVAGAWFERHGMSDFPTWTVCTLLAVNASVWLMPRSREPIAASHDSVSVASVMRQRETHWFFASVFFHVLAHIGIYVFFSLYVDSLGYSKTMIGVLWAVSVAMEIVGFFTQSRWMHHLSLAAWLCVCTAAMVLRMGLTAWWGDVLWVLLAAQLLHALTFAVHHTVCIAWLSKNFPGRLRGRGQALYAVIGYGMTGVLGALGGGAISTHWGLPAIYAVSTALAGMGLVCAWGLWRCVHHHR